ncbi:hypothetical protein [Actinomyces provencensis]|uniref:hypothetical protein n=1 Tax=Actinomyces provencensis TaxID=1720198 RepID=UPI001177A6C4|nr:hypothetical protein [Actinomyces provencensis]
MDDTPDTAGATDHDDAAVPDGEPEPGEADAPATPADEERATLRSLRDGHPTLDDLTQADLEELDELLDEY